MHTIPGDAAACGFRRAGVQLNRRAHPSDRCRSWAVGSGHRIRGKTPLTLKEKKEVKSTSKGSSATNAFVNMRFSLLLPASYVTGVRGSVLVSPSHPFPLFFSSCALVLLCPQRVSHPLRPSSFTYVCAPFASSLFTSPAHLAIPSSRPFFFACRPPALDVSLCVFLSFLAVVSSLLFAFMFVCVRDCVLFATCVCVFASMTAPAGCVRHTNRFFPSSLFNASVPRKTTPFPLPTFLFLSLPRNT